MYEQTMYHRTSLLVGEDGILKLKNANVWLFGVGGVGGFAGEALVRAGIGNITVVDNDTVNITNINRQIIALHSTIGMPKVEAFLKRAKDINPDVNITCFDKCYLPQNSNEFDFSKADYVIDAVDMVTAKIELAKKAKEFDVPLISSMGTGNKLTNTEFQITDIYKTDTDPLAKVMRRELKKHGIDKLTVVYSRSKPVKIPSENGERPITASVPWVPSVGGLIIAGKVIEDILKG